MPTNFLFLFLNLKLFSYFFFAPRTNTPFLASIAMFVVTMLELSTLSSLLDFYQYLALLHSLIYKR